MILIYTPKITNRVNYIFKFIFKDILGVDVSCSNNRDVFLAYQGAKLSYGSSPLGDELFFMAKPLLFETGINEQAINIFDWEGEKVFFSTHKNSALPFDPFAAAFYLVSRYEEYLPHKKDKYDRFDARESLAYQHDFLHKPVIDQWAYRIKQILQDKFPQLEFPKKKFTYISTIDVDNAFAYKEKGFLRTTLALLRSAARLELDEFAHRFEVLINKEPDPFDTYDYQLSLLKKYGFKSIYFFLVADYGENDKNVTYQSNKVQSLIKSIADYAEVGIHPGYGSNYDKKKLAMEHARLENILNREVTKSRQHFLKLTLPKTYRNLIDLDITDDYTMGFSSHYGFRAGTCTSFQFYDLDLEIVTPLRVHPFAYMEGTLKDYMKIPAAKAFDHIKHLIDEVKAVNGTFISLWHNDSLSDLSQWEGWRKVYEQTIQHALAE